MPPKDAAEAAEGTKASETGEAEKAAAKKEATEATAKSQSPAADAPAAGGASKSAAGGAEAAAEEKEKVPEVPVDDQSLGIFVDSDGCFDAARSAARALRELVAELGKAKKGQQDGAKAEGSSEGGGASEDLAAFAKTARDLQLQLLGLRRAHRAMAKVADAGRTAEASARRLADAEFAHLETRRYESACCRAAARRCRSFPTPQLSQVRPWLDGRDGQQQVDEGEDEDHSEEEVASDAERQVPALMKRLEVEGKKRGELAEELEKLEHVKADDFSAFKERSQTGSELAQKLQAVELALEPVSSFLELRTRPEGQQLPAEVEQLPTPLRLLYSKFDVFAVFGADAGVTVDMEGTDGEPAAKKPKLDASAVSSSSAASSAIRVGVAPAPGRSPEVFLRFECARAPARGGDAKKAPSPAPAAPGDADLVAVSIEGNGGDALLDALWPEDDGRGGALATAADAAKLSGRAFGWAQVLAGLRERTAPLLPVVAASLFGVGGGNPLASGEPVTASDVVQRLRRAMAAAK